MTEKLENWKGENERTDKTASERSNKQKPTTKTETTKKLRLSL